MFFVLCSLLQAMMSSSVQWGSYGIYTWNTVPFKHVAACAISMLCAIVLPCVWNWSVLNSSATCKISKASSAIQSNAVNSFLWFFSEIALEFESMRMWKKCMKCAQCMKCTHTMCKKCEGGGCLQSWRFHRLSCAKLLLCNDDDYNDYDWSSHWYYVNGEMKELCQSVPVTRDVLQGQSDIRPMVSWRAIASCANASASANGHSCRQAHSKR